MLHVASYSSFFGEFDFDFAMVAYQIRLLAVLVHYPQKHFLKSFVIRTEGEGSLLEWRSHLVPNSGCDVATYHL